MVEDTKGAASAEQLETCERGIALLRARGLRVTTARKVVIETLALGEGHPTADDLSAAIAERHPAVHRATVYRTLDTLADIGIVAHVHFGQGGAVYHLVGPARKMPHLHAHCQRCGRVFDLPESLMDSVAAEVRTELGFELEAAHHALSGFCRECRHSKEVNTV